MITDVLLYPFHQTSQLDITHLFILERLVCVLFFSSPSPSFLSPFFLDLKDSGHVNGNSFSPVKGWRSLPAPGTRYIHVSAMIPTRADHPGQ